MFKHKKITLIKGLPGNLNEDYLETTHIVDQGRFGWFMTTRIWNPASKIKSHIYFRRRIHFETASKNETIQGGNLF